MTLHEQVRELRAGMARLTDAVAGRAERVQQLDDQVERLDERLRELESLASRVDRLAATVAELVAAVEQAAADEMLRKPTEEVDQVLREAGADPEEVAQRGAAFVSQLAKARRQAKQAAPSELSTAAKEARKPLPPEALFDAKSERVHRELGRARAAHVVRGRSPAPTLPEVVYEEEPEATEAVPKDIFRMRGRVRMGQCLGHENEPPAWCKPGTPVWYRPDATKRYLGMISDSEPWWDKRRDAWVVRLARMEAHYGNACGYVNADVSALEPVCGEVHENAAGWERRALEAERTIDDARLALGPAWTRSMTLAEGIAAKCAALEKEAARAFEAGEESERRERYG